MYLDSVPVDSFLLFEQCLANIWHPYSVPAATRDIVQSLPRPGRLVRPARSYPLTSGGGPTTSSLANPSQTTDDTPKSSSTVVYPVDSPLTPESSSVILVNSELSDLWDRAEKILSNDKDKRTRKLLQAYLEILGLELTKRETSARQEQMCELLNTQVEELENNKWRLRLDDHDVGIEIIFTSVFNKILLAKDIITSADEKNAGGTICILDALDECEERERSQLTEALHKFYRTRANKFALKFLLTSRPYTHIRREFQSLKNRLPTIHLSGEDELELEKIPRRLTFLSKAELGTLEQNCSSFQKNERFCRMSSCVSLIGPICG